MAEPFLAEVRIFSFNWAPKGWAACNGQFLPINQNQPLFALLGTTFGGNGQTTFQLPDMRGRSPLHVGSNHDLGERAGQEAHTLSLSELPTHQHTFNARDAVATTADPMAGVMLAQSTGSQIYGPASNLGSMAAEPAAIVATGGSQPHNNMMPYLTLNFCIALQGIFPSPN